MPTEMPTTRPPQVRKPTSTSSHVSGRAKLLPSNRRQTSFTARQELQSPKSSIASPATTRAFRISPRSLWPMQSANHRPRASHQWPLVPWSSPGRDCGRIVSKRPDRHSSHCPHDWLESDNSARTIIETPTRRASERLVHVWLRSSIENPGHTLRGHFVRHQSPDALPSRFS
ncbi:MAG: hypothetical protein FD138_4641 [Planctomycetota bacterium]|nr:MAG: hypothetical protein FD138_4641 [Planctomycetota bacterium]